MPWKVVKDKSKCASGYALINSETGEIIKKDPVESYGAHDEKGNPICYSFESTYEFLKQYLKNKTNE